MLLAIIGMSVTLLQITQQNDIIKSCRYTLYVVGQLIHLFWFSFEGQKLIDHSLQMSDKIYNSSWYEVSASSQKLIILVMMRSTRPSVLSAGKIFIFSLESFTTVRPLEITECTFYRDSLMRLRFSSVRRPCKPRCRTSRSSQPFSVSCLWIRRHFAALIERAGPTCLNAITIIHLR
ncbi:hypothetical protein PUN28_005418 [Cardiocondyla obscurior]